MGFLKKLLVVGEQSSPFVCLFFNYFNMLMMKRMRLIFLFGGLVFLAGCATKTDPSFNKQELKIGMSEDDVQAITRTSGQKAYYSITNTKYAPYSWIFDTENERVWLSGNAFLGGTVTTGHHGIVLSIEEGKVKKIDAFYKEGFNKKNMPGNLYLQMALLGGSLNSCKNHFSVSQRANYSHILSEIINSWIFSDVVFKNITEYQNQNGGKDYPTTKEQCDDASVIFQRAQLEMAQSQK